MSDRETFLKYQNMSGEQLESVVSKAVGCPYILPLYTSVKNHPAKKNMSMFCFCTALMGDPKTAEDWLMAVGESLSTDIAIEFFKKNEDIDESLWPVMAVEKCLKVFCFGHETSGGARMKEFSIHQMLSLSCIIADCEEEGGHSVTMFDDWIYENVESMLSLLEEEFKGAVKGAEKCGISQEFVKNRNDSVIECITRIKNRVDGRVKLGITGSEFIESIH